MDRKFRLPEDKFDVEAAAQLIAAGHAAVEPILFEILDWMQDMNWPVAEALVPLFDGMGDMSIAPIRRVFASGDHIWTGWVVQCVVPRLTDSAQRALRGEIEAMALYAGPNEDARETACIAGEYLASRG